MIFSAASSGSAPPRTASTASPYVESFRAPTPDTSASADVVAGRRSAIAVSVSTLILGLLLLWLAPRAAEATFARMREGGWGPSIGIGFVVVIGLPVLAFIALVTLVGIPFGIGLLLAATGFLGFEATSLFSEEAKNPLRTIPRATYAAICVIGPSPTAAFSASRKA